jgi:A/G-specific adenine glycosylase
MNIKKLEAWYLVNQRKLSFRNTKNPYHIWVSEIMLQQTQVETVLPYFERFIQKYPTVFELAKANEEELQKDVEGIGYYRRFRNMHLAAKIIVNEHDGFFPNTYEEVLNLPGIGKYTAGAIMSIAYNEPYSALDGNVVRVLSRFYANSNDMRQEKNRKVLDQINQQLVEKATPEIYTHAIMELGATLCRPKNPQCEICPLKNDCLAFHKNLVSVLPYLSKLKPKVEMNYITLFIEKDGYIFLNKREEDLLKGMYEYPQFESESILSVIAELESRDIFINVMKEMKTYKHVFTHQVWHMNVYFVTLLSEPYPSWVKVKKDELNQLPMAIAHRKIK